MPNSYTLSSSLTAQAYTQEYSAKPQIEGLQFLTLKTSVTDEGDFGEVLRLNETGQLEIMPSFQLRQINRTTLFPKTIKAWHFHYHQDEIWYVPPAQQLTIGLWDVREGSRSTGLSQKITLGGGSSRLLFIPRGVAHGLTNYSAQNVELFYFVSNQFNPSAPDEHRLPWDANGAAFWAPERD